MRTFRHILSAFLASFFLVSVTVAEISDEDLVRFVGEADKYRIVFGKVQSTIKKDDREGFAALVHYPFTIYQEKEECCGSDAVDTVEDREEFVERFDEIVTPEVRHVIKNQEFDELILNWRGLGFDVGTVWIVGYCVGEDEDDPCTETVVGVKSVNADAAKHAVE